MNEMIRILRDAAAAQEAAKLQQQRASVEAAQQAEYAEVVRVTVEDDTKRMAAVVAESPEQVRQAVDHANAHGTSYGEGVAAVKAGKS